MTDLSKQVIPILLIPSVLLFVGWLYWPGQSGPVLLDDRSSVMVIGDLRSQPELAWDYVFGDESGALGRPVSMLSFVLEKTLLDGSNATSKLINIVLHLINGGLVFWLFCLLFRHISADGYRWLALVLAAAWLLSPLYVSTVLYIVQRMAMLSTTFMLASSICFVYWRVALARGNLSISMFTLIIVFFLLALFAKENAIVLVPILLLAETLWFEFKDESGKTLPVLRGISLSLIALGGVGLIAALAIQYDSLSSSYSHRYFSLEERLLTQAPIVWDYVSQIYLPNVFSMGLYHDDYPLSTSFDTPSATLWAIFAWCGILVLFSVLILFRWGRYCAFGIAWFLVGQSVESTVFPLELYFEHRNYFPGIGLFLLIGVLLAWLNRRWSELKVPLLVYLTCYVVWLASLTSSQVQIWSSHPLLILSHLNAHPDSFRANADMAVQMANIGEFTAAKRYSDRAFEVDVAGEHQGDHELRNAALSCIANQPVAAKAIDELGMSNTGRPFGSVTTLLTLVRLLQDNTCPDFDRVRFADHMAELYLGEYSEATAAPRIYSSLALLENSMQRWTNANAYMDKFLEMSPWNANALLMKLHFVTALGTVEEASAIKNMLKELDRQGKLTEGELQTLALYLEN